MRALTLVGPDTLEWQDAARPQIGGDGEALVRPRAVATCDLDDILVRGHPMFPPPFVVGHEMAGEVVAVGDGVRSVQPGDRVIVPFQISCGTCGACGAGRTGNCDSVPFGSTYGFGAGAARWGGFLADAVHVPYADAMLVKVPDQVSDTAAAGVSDNITDAYRAVAPGLRVHPGAPVLVIGGAGPGSIGLYAVAHARAMGSERVVYIDPDAGRRAIARAYGAEVREDLPDRLDQRFPVAVDASARLRGLELALSSLDRDGICTSTAIYFERGVRPEIPLLSMYLQNTTFVTGRIHARRDAPDVLDLLVSGTLDPAPVTTRTLPIDEAADALSAHDYTKLIFTA